MREYAIQDLSRFKVPPGFRGRPSYVVALWWIVEATLFRYSPAMLYGWRRWLLRAFGAKIGRKARIKPTVRIVYPWKLEVGEYCWVGQRVDLYSLGPIIIGNNVCISQDSYLCTGSHDQRTTTFDIFEKPIVIGDEAWVASQSFIMPGVTIGRGAVVGVRSLVLHDVEAETVVVGQPARPVGKRRG
ncbi:WcaF family extracellular polysaccharide biosynthesis acetyltransferase [Xanthobacter sp. 126]|uniref:WcaF family extracellular polysaccharide biosynthesis acetyltransferase n=1 Tax=Xanthobacter sp. 126 TaxID=1131814 RepID=UPI0004B522E9|nr:WcaF family extracellular polysaccharide biosynthesis acetyltransferase [Xanthobacter sp. 126]